MAPNASEQTCFWNSKSKVVKSSRCLFDHGNINGPEINKEDHGGTSTLDSVPNFAKKFAGGHTFWSSQTSSSGFFGAAPTFPNSITVYTEMVSSGPNLGTRVAHSWTEFLFRIKRYWAVEIVATIKPTIDIY